MGIFQLQKLIELQSYDMWILYMYRNINTFMYVTLTSTKKSDLGRRTNDIDIRN